MRSTKKLRLESENYCVAAPFDGVIVDFLKQQGEFVGPSDPTVCILAELSTLSVEFLVPRRHREGLKVGDEIEVHFVDSGRRVPGSVYFISPFPNGETNTFEVKVRVRNDNHELNAGERCQLERLSDGFRQASEIPTSEMLTSETESPKSPVQ